MKISNLDLSEKWGAYTLSGNIISKPPLSGVSGIQFENSSGNLYGLHWNNSLQMEYFVYINISNGSLISLIPIPSVVSVDMGYPTFDEINRRYTFCGSDISGIRHIYTLDATNGLVVSSPNYPAFTSPYNLLETEYDNTDGNLYALHWGPVKEVTGIKNEVQNFSFNIFPNPATSNLTIELPETISKASLKIFNMIGDLEYSSNLTGEKTTIDVSALTNGLYLIQVSSGNKISSQKFIKE